MQRLAEIENWSKDIYRPALSKYCPNMSKNALKGNGQGLLTCTVERTWVTVYSSSGKPSSKESSASLAPQSKSMMSLPEMPCPFPLQNVVESEFQFFKVGNFGHKVGDIHSLPMSHDIV